MSRQKKKYQIQSVGAKGIWWASLFCRICKYITEGNDAFIWGEPPETKFFTTQKLHYYLTELSHI